MMELEQGEHAFFRVGGDAEIIIKNGSLTNHPGDAVILPTNTECIVSGAADAAFRAVGIDEVSGKASDVFYRLFGISIENPPIYEANSYIDFEIRDSIGGLGGAMISKPIMDLNPELPQRWKWFILAFIRSQSRPPDFTDNVSKDSIEGAINNALDIAATHQVETIVTVPFGTGFHRISPEDAAQFMIPALVDRLESNSNPLRRVTIVESTIRKYLRYSQATAGILSERANA